MPAEFAIGATSAEHFPKDGLPEIAFVGRSNVGKSSLLNALLKRRKIKGPAGQDAMARTSRTPGRTQGVHFYRVDGGYYFVDLPGYGYARVSRQAWHEWTRLAESYLSRDPGPRLVVAIVDSRHGPSELDRQMSEWLEANRRPFVVVASKADKLKQSERATVLRAIADTFHPVLPVSASTGEGIPALWSEIRRALEGPNHT